MLAAAEAHFARPNLPLNTAGNAALVGQRVVIELV
jgi:hypothetical protein